MKKLLITFVLLLTTFLTFSQSAPYYVRAEAFQMGSKDSKNNVTWDNKTYRECDVLIKLNETDITIYSQTRQEYHVISFDGKLSNGSRRWYCSDLLGRTCNFYLGSLKSSPGYLSVTVEFSDYVWFYICKPSK